MNLFDNDLFSEISSDTKLKFEKAAITKACKKGEIIFLQEEDAKYFYIVKSGWIKLFRETIDGEEAIVDVVTEGHIFGNHSAFDELKYSYSAEAVENAILYQIPISLIIDNVSLDQKFALNFIKLISTKQKKNRREIEHLTVQTAPQRIGCFLLRLCNKKDNKNVKLFLPYDKSLIASRLGMKAETFSRALTKLKEETGIIINGPSVIIPDVSRLSTYTCNACSDIYPCEDVKV
ncbi:MAG: Crp/Fnr family transcriptional regulator [Rickettsiales bacterium]|nr:Crp/Fnr family transcriptional regulator [Rickettsiales bacterium]